MARSSKTSKVMNLIAPEPEKNTASQEETPETPEITEPEKPKKSRRRAIVKNMELKTEAMASPLLTPPQTEGKTVYVKPAGERQVVNVAAILINEQLGYALERFNICACQVCCLEITLRALRELPPAFVQVSTINEADFVNAEINRLRPDVIKILAKLSLAARNAPYHNQVKNRS